MSQEPLKQIRETADPKTKSVMEALMQLVQKAAAGDERAKKAVDVVESLATGLRDILNEE